MNILVWNKLRMAKSLSHFWSRIWRCSFHFKVLWRFEHRKEVHQKSGQKELNCILGNCDFTGKMSILREFFQHVPQKNRNFFYPWDYNAFARRILYKSCRFWFWSFYFCLTHCRVLPVWVWGSYIARKLVTLEGWVILPVKSHDEYLSQVLSDCKVLWMNLEQLVETFIKLPIFGSSRAICVLLRGQNQLLVPAGWGKARKFHRTPSRGRIESKTSAGKKSQRVYIRKVGLGISRTNVDSQLNPVYNVFHLIFLLWKRNDSSVVLYTWSWRGKPAASARAELRKANAER